MARHSLFPNSITINYHANGHSHKQVLPVAAITPSGDTWTLETRGSGAVEWTAAVDDLIALYKPLFDASSSFDSAELFDYEATESPAIFLASYDIEESGTNVGSAADFVQAVMPLKAAGGTSLRLTLIESTVPADTRLTLAGLGASNYATLIEYVLSDDDWIITRGGTFPTSSLGITTKENDKLRERYLLD